MDLGLGGVFICVFWMSMQIMSGLICNFSGDYRNKCMWV